MKVDFDLIEKSASTLSGLSFAAFSFGYTCMHSATTPEAFRMRMAPFLEWTIDSTVCFFISCLVSFYAISFLDKSGQEKAGRLSVISFFAGLLSFGLALLAVYGISLQVIRLP